MGKHVTHEYREWKIGKWYADDDGWFRRLHGAKIQHLTKTSDRRGYELYLADLKHQAPYFDPAAEPVTRLVTVLRGLDKISKTEGLYDA